MAERSIELGPTVRPTPQDRPAEQNRTTPAAWIPWLVPSLADVIFVTLLGLALGPRVHAMFNSDGDLARHLAVGRQILADGAIPSIDLFSHTRGGDAFVPYEWLSELLFALVHRSLGLEGVAVFSATMAALPFLLLVRWMVRGGANPFVVVCLTTMGALASSMHWLARPHLFTLLFATLWARALCRHAETGSLRPLLALPPLMVLWANTHGGFLVGFVILGIYIVAAPGAPAPMAGLRAGRRSGGRAILPLALVGILSLAATGLNPAGYTLIPHVTSYFGSQFLVDITVEYLSPDFHNVGPQLFLGLVLVAMVSMTQITRPIGGAELGMLVVWTAFSLYSARNIPLFVVVCLPIVARLATRALPTVAVWRPDENGSAPRQGLAERLAAVERELGRPLLPAIAVGVALLIYTGTIGDLRPRALLDPTVFPVEAVARAEAIGAKGRLFNYFPWGGYVLYAAYPEHRVFIDGQTDFYGEELTRDYLKVSRLEPDWESVLDRYQVEWILFPHQSPLSLLLARVDGWKLVYQDGTADIFVRTGEGGR